MSESFLFETLVLFDLKVSRGWCASFIWRIMQNSPHEVFQCVVLGYNRLKKNRVTRGLPTSFQSHSLLKVKGDSDGVRNKIILEQIRTLVYKLTCSNYWFKNEEFCVDIKNHNKMIFNSNTPYYLNDSKCNSFPRFIHYIISY